MALSFGSSLDLLFSWQINSASSMFIDLHRSSRLHSYWHSDFPMPSIVENVLGSFLPGSIAVKLAYMAHCRRKISACTCAVRNSNWKLRKMTTNAKNYY